MKKSLIFISLLFIAIKGISQVPDTDIYLVEINNSDGKLIFGKPVNITDREGYDNQPMFTPKSDKIIFVSMIDTTQTDLYEYKIADKKTKRLTNTPESEYSPTYAPNSNALSVVRVDTDKAQHLYEFESTDLEANVLIDESDSIGYYKWINDSILGLIVLNNGLELHIFELLNKQYVVAAKGAGRCMMIEPSTGKLLYTKPSEEGPADIMILDTEDFSSEMYCTGIGKSEDFLITPKGDIWTGSEGKLYSRNCSEGTDWKEIADFTKTIGSFYRIALSPDGKYLAVVAYKGEKP